MRVQLYQFTYGGKLLAPGFELAEEIQGLLRASRYFIVRDRVVQMEDEIGSICACIGCRSLFTSNSR